MPGGAAAYWLCDDLRIDRTELLADRVNLAIAASGETSSSRAAAPRPASNPKTKGSSGWNRDLDARVSPPASLSRPPKLRAVHPSPSSPLAADVPEWRIIAPGRNCWRVVPASRGAVLVDGAAYFSRLEAALRRARRSVLIVGWDFDGRIRLRPEAPEEDSPPLGPLLRALVEARPELEVRILIWSVAVLHAPGAPGQLLFGADWQDHARLTLKLDTHHPIYAAHHQKIVCMDDELAFVGGIDLTVRRWDTSRHAIDDPVRLQPDESRYHPVHDVQMAVDGLAAQSLAELARARWKAATGEVLAPVPARRTDPWPADLDPHFTNVAVAIARTMPAMGDQPAISEVAKLTADALNAARRSIYIEAQYMTASFVGDVLERQLAASDGPEIVVLMTYESHGFAEQLVMGKNRDRLIRRLKRADRHGRLRVYYPCVPAGDGERRQVLIHSKLIIVDDVFLRVGSSNLNNRSIGLDTECDLAIEASDAATRSAIRALRDTLLAEHLDTSPEAVAEAVAEEGSLVRAVERLNGRPRGMTAFDALRDRGPTRPVLGTRLLDPTGPFEPLWFLRRKRRRGTA
jgi:phosphatidylserine/phosphatidylglycerophosphate/cardiolipin synthase-like enzyme